MSANDPFAEIVTTGINDNDVATAITTLKNKLIASKTKSDAFAGAHVLGELVAKLRNLGA